MEIDMKEVMNSYMNYIIQLRNTPEEELSELGKLSKLWAENVSEEELERLRDYRNNLPTEEDND